MLFLSHMSSQGLLCGLPTNYDGNVLMKNNIPYKTLGIESIKIRMHDGIVRMLSNIRHVSGLKKNLFSLDTLDSNGYKFLAKGGVLRVSKGSLVVMKGKKVIPLYPSR